MAEHTHIEWTDATWNPVTGCSVVSPGCTNCYAMKLAGTRLRDHPSRKGLTTPSKAGPVWTGEVRFNPEWLDQPLRWRRPRRVFVCAHADLFHESVPDAVIDQVFAVMALASHHTFQVLTKRAARMRAYLEKAHPGQWADAIPTPSNMVMSKHEMECRLLGVAPELYHQAPIRLPLPNVHLGVSAEDQPRANERIPELLATPAAVRFVSLEPLLGVVDLDVAWASEGALDAECWGECAWCAKGLPPLHDCRLGRQSELEARRGRSGLDWVIVGGESGPGARPMHPDWVRLLRDQCAWASVPFFFKQWGAWTPGENLGPARGPQRGAWLGEGDDWSFEDLTQKAANDLTCDDEPDVWLAGKKAAGRLLDGNEHNGMPEGAA